MKTVEYFMIPSSPWTYLGHARLAQIAKQHQARIVMKPFDLGQVFPVSGGLPLPKRAPQRQAYRLQELARWRDFLKVELTIEPKYFPVPADPAMLLIIAAQQTQGDDAGFKLAGAIMTAVWAREQNIADEDTLRKLTEAQGFDHAALLAGAQQAGATLAENTKEAIDAQVFGSPWYRIGNETFWGQDRLDFVERRLAE
jgi:2-hydroxychromene-2-carboxylate isomerase